MEQRHIRNFCIIAHIDHGKSTLADRLLELTGTVSEREMREQFLDQMELERERGITIKAQAVRMSYIAPDGAEYQLNLIDTPGHVDFTYEVSRSLTACEGALLVVDAAQGIQAQTLANVYIAQEHNLTLIPVVNKIDLPNAEPEKVAKELECIIGFLSSEVIFASAKEGIGTKEVLEAIIQRIPPPKGEAEGPLRALIFDSKYDPYKGVIAYLRVFDGVVSKERQLMLMSTGRPIESLEIGVFKPGLTPVARLVSGEVGYLATGLKSVGDCRVGDTITLEERGAVEPLAGYRPAKPMVFAGIYPLVGDDYNDLREGLEKLSLNDAALSFEPETSAALGFGFRCGFLGTLHMEIVRERLRREYGLDLLATAPSVEYQVTKDDGIEITVSNPSKMPPSGEIAELREPWMSISIITPVRYIGSVMELLKERRGDYRGMEYFVKEVSQPQNAGASHRVLLQYDVPLAEIIINFYDQLKSRTQGYASMDYIFAAHLPAKLVKLEILVNNQPVDAFSLIVPQERAYRQGRELVHKLRKLIPRQNFEVAIQAAIGQKVIVRENIKAYRKDVIAKCYGGDITRKRKLLEKQSAGKKRMKMVGRVEVPPEAFVEVLKL
ncbi:MAG: translation elongation factor 4 [Dehalococcoidia bacterium]|nr:translation elongation factor 4 [Dehalococcoidia bacterium]